jgi:hypothetical protein
LQTLASARVRFDHETNVSIRGAIEIINRMEAEGIIGRYAVGGAIAATFYLEPSATEDIDIFVALPRHTSGALVSLEPIYRYLRERGCPPRGPYVILASWPVQFLPPTSALVEEALRDAVEKDIDGVFVRVFSPEHLAAIALELGRPKDRLRLAQFIEERAVAEPTFLEILTRHDLLDRWFEFKRRVLDPL